MVVVFIAEDDAGKATKVSVNGNLCANDVVRKYLQLCRRREESPSSFLLRDGLGHVVASDTNAWHLDQHHFTIERALQRWNARTPNERVASPAAVASLQPSMNAAATPVDPNVDVIGTRQQLLQLWNWHARTTAVASSAATAARSPASRQVVEEARRRYAHEWKLPTDAPQPPPLPCTPEAEAPSSAHPPPSSASNPFVPPVNSASAQGGCPTHFLPPQDFQESSGPLNDNFGRRANGDIEDHRWGAGSLAASVPLTLQEPSFQPHRYHQQQQHCQQPFQPHDHQLQQHYYHHHHHLHQQHYYLHWQQLHHQGQANSHYPQHSYYPHLFHSSTHHDPSSIYYAFPPHPHDHHVFHSHNMAFYAPGHSMWHVNGDSQRRFSHESGHSPMLNGASQAHASKHASSDYARWWNAEQRQWHVGNIQQHHNDMKVFHAMRRELRRMAHEEALSRTQIVAEQELVYGRGVASFEGFIEGLWAQHLAGGSALSQLVRREKTQRRVLLGEAHAAVKFLERQHERLVQETNEFLSSVATSRALQAEALARELEDEALHHSIFFISREQLQHEEAMDRGVIERQCRVAWEDVKDAAEFSSQQASEWARRSSGLIFPMRHVERRLPQHLISIARSPSESSFQPSPVRGH